MSSRPKTVYRGRRRYRWIITLLLFILAALIITGIWLFYYLEQYIVYDKDGVRLVLPNKQTEESEDPEEGVYRPIVTLDPSEFEIIIEPPDFSSVETSAGEGVSDVKGFYISAGNVNPENINYYAGLEETKALMIQMKAPIGYFSYHSTVEFADGYGVNGVAEIAEALANAKEKGIYLIGDISALVDNAMAERYRSLALIRYGTAHAMSDGRGAYLDPYNGTVRNYIESAMEELADLGFDEVVLSNVLHPVGDVVYSQHMTGAMDLVSCISAFSLDMASRARDLGIRVSVKCDSDALHAGEMESVGQDLSFFFRVFDRVYFDTSSDYYQYDMGRMTESLGSEKSARIVPMMVQNVPEWGSYISK